MKKFSLLLMVLALSSCAPKAYLWNAENATVDMDVYEQQYKLNKAEWDAAFKFLSDPETMSLPAGRYELTDRTFANIQIDSTRTVMQWEDHHKKIDLFYVAEGVELVNVCKPEELLDCTRPYTDEKDVENYRSSSNPRPVVLTPGKYVILFPSDAHQPMLDPDGKPAPIKKIVVKLPFAAE